MALWRHRSMFVAIKRSMVLPWLSLYSALAMRPRTSGVLHGDRWDIVRYSPSLLTESLDVAKSWYFNMPANAMPGSSS